MANTPEPLPSTSQSNGTLHRADTSLNAPLSEAEYAQLKNELGPNFGQSTARGGGAQETASSGICDDQPSNQEILWGTSLQDPLTRADTMERNPVCIDPNLMTIKHERNATTTDVQGNERYTTVSIPVTTATLDANVTQINWEDPRIVFGPEDANMWMQTNAANYDTAVAPTSVNPCIDNYSGQCNFQVAFKAMTDASKTKHWDYSELLKKLFVDMNKYVLGTFNVGPNPPEGLLIRALPVFAVPGFFTCAVRRCPNHASSEDPSNKDEMWKDKRDHLIRVDNDFAIYDEDPESKRLSVIVPVQKPEIGSTTFSIPMKFMCLGSDVGGINRRPVKIIFTLEHGTGNVIARHAIDVRICSCPKRDKTQEEKREEEKSSVRKDGEPVATSSLMRSNSSLVVAPQEKKRKVDSIEDYVLVPVAKRDFDAVNKHAEALLISRHPEKIAEIRCERKRLILKRNPSGSFGYPKPKPPNSQEENK